MDTEYYTSDFSDIWGGVSPALFTPPKYTLYLTLGNVISLTRQRYISHAWRRAWCVRQA